MQLRQRIIAWAAARAPDFVIGGQEDPYLCRWWLMPRNALGEGRERGILREASSGEAATSTDGLEGKGRCDAG